MINLCFVSGKVINEIDLKFIYNIKKRSLSKKHISIVEVILEEKNNVIYAKAYDQTAEYIYSHIQKDNLVMIYGKLRENYIEILQIEAILNIVESEGIRLSNPTQDICIIEK